MFESAHLYNRYRYIICIQRQEGFASEEGRVALPWAHDAHHGLKVVVINYVMYR